MSVFCENKSNLQNKCFFFDNKKYAKLMKVSFPILSLLFLKKKSVTSQFLAVSINLGNSTLTYLTLILVVCNFSQR